MKKLLTILCFLSISSIAFASPMTIMHFDIRENPYEQDQVSIVAVDTAHNTDQNIAGDFVFTINGFEDTLKFVSGVAFYKHKIDRSTFLYARHVNDITTVSSLYYVYKSESKLVPVHISWVWLIAIPVILVLLGYMFKRFIIIVVILFLIFFFFNYHNNLTIPTFFQSIFDGLKHAL